MHAVECVGFTSSRAHSKLFIDTELMILCVSVVDKPGRQPCTTRIAERGLRKTSRFFEMGNDGKQLSPDEAGASKSSHALLKVPSRSSSQKGHQSSAASTGLSGATVTDPRSSIGGRSKESRGSISGRQRNGSASSHRTGGESEQGNVVGNSHVTSPTTSEQKKRKKKGGGIFSFLGCCGVPENANTLEETDNENVHKVEKLPQRPTTSKNRPQGLQENQPGKQQSEKDEDTIESSNTPDRANHQGSSSGADVPSNVERANESKQAVPPTVMIDGPGGSNGNAIETIEDGDAARNDDVEMQDVSQEVPQETPLTDKTDDSQSHTIPPPPPGPGPAVVAPIALVEDGPSAPEHQKSLLPPIAPEHKGRKCLVLDLDETLVHSSFKVCHRCDHWL